MSKKKSKLEIARNNGKTQVDEQRIRIIDTAEKLFLEKGLENTNMSDIASQAGITRMTLYRYFPDRDPIAFEIAVRMMKKIAGSYDLGGRAVTLLTAKEIALAAIDLFYPNREAYHYIGMFRNFYRGHYPNETLKAWYEEQMLKLEFGGNSRDQVRLDDSEFHRIVMIINTVLGFLQRMAAGGELIAVLQSVPMDEQLSLFKEMIGSYFDLLIDRDKK
jgi:AcrR family transcriptional regulator